MTIHFEFILCEISSIVMMVSIIGKSSSIACVTLETMEKNKKMLLQTKREWL